MLGFVPHPTTYALLPARRAATLDSVQALGGVDRMNASQEVYKFIHTQVCLANDGSQRTSVKFVMVRYDYLSKWIRSTKYHVTAGLSAE